MTDETLQEQASRGNIKMNASLALKSYRNVNANGLVADATPHRLVQMLMQGALDRIHAAESYLKQKNIPARGESIGKAIDIIGYLQGCLDLEHGGEVAANLDKLYEYMLRRLFHANVKADMAALEEVAGLMQTIKDGWDQIAP